MSRDIFYIFITFSKDQLSQAFMGLLLSGKCPTGHMECLLITCGKLFDEKTGGNPQDAAR
jgi:hypothetical protein